ncbi:MAG TPA: 16S rRNA (cytidine(1402)-2'-O)-methyltransferase [Vicinamibacterales bacterium]|nr:16S rRNA (cytidine(1402)-2'-O)-methyltransferase [Vicinamibacterales bacterium]
MAGTLFVVATPIGNLEDITLRALRTLREADLIAAEDTRRTAKLLAHYKIQRPMVSLHEHNEHHEAPKLVERLIAGTSIALVSDAGTPGVADPGELLVKLALERGLRVSPIPGASAVMAALSVSGTPASEFVFMGFPPHGGKARTEWIGRLANEQRTVVAFEAPHRIVRALNELNELVNKHILVLREATKVHEQLVISQIQQQDAIPPLGEFVLVISSAAPVSDDYLRVSAGLETAISMIGCMTTNNSFDIDRATELAAAAVGLDIPDVKKAWKKHRISENRRREQLS